MDLGGGVGWRREIFEILETSSSQLARWSMGSRFVALFLAEQHGWILGRQSGLKWWVKYFIKRRWSPSQKCIFLFPVLYVSMKLTPISSLTTTTSASSHWGSEILLWASADLILLAHVIWERLVASNELATLNINAGSLKAKGTHWEGKQTLAVLPPTIELKKANEKGGSGGVSLLLREEVATETPQVAAKSMCFLLELLWCSKVSFHRYKSPAPSPQNREEISIPL